MTARAPILALLALSWALVMANSLPAQEEDHGGQDNGMGELFGPGKSIRGIITAVSAATFVLRTDEGETYKVFYSPNTHLLKNHQPIEANQIKVGDMLIAAGQVDPKARTVGAVFVLDVDAAEVRKAREEFGKTWIMGKVIAIHDLKITVERMDNKQPEVVAVDENTSFRHHHEMVTLGDIKVGDFVSAQGALQNNVFVATTLNLMGPKAANLLSLPPGF